METGTLVQRENAALLFFILRNKPFFHAGTNDLQQKRSPMDEAWKSG
jgi:hypothetical protein